jgi:uncharacterized protein
MMLNFSWQGVQPRSTERLQLTVGEHVRARSVVASGDERYDYEVTLAYDWVFRQLTVHSRDERRLDVRRDPDGSWTVDGELRPDLMDAIDIDLAFSPFTNTLPIRRLNLAIGSAAVITTAYIDGPSLRVVPDAQSYTRTANNRYLYESLDGDFSREITVDAQGFVIDYPGLFSRFPLAGHHPVAKPPGTTPSPF